MPMKALIIGATGATGKDLVKVLLDDPSYTEVVTFVRKSTGMTHPKLIEQIVDFGKLEEMADSIRGDVWFSCLGTTLKAAGSKEKQWQIDYEIPARFAEIAKKNGVRSAVLVSAYGASATSSVFYSKMKGQLEDRIAELAFDQYVIFRPGMLLRKDTDRVSEKAINVVLNVVNGIGLFRKFKPLSTSVLAARLAKAPKTLPGGIHFVELEKIFSF